MHIRLNWYNTPMDEHSKQLVEYIKQHLEQGIPPEHIRQALMQYQWDEASINQAFAAAQSPPANP